MNNFVKRTLSGILFIAVIISSIMLSHYTFAVIFALISGLTLHEFHRLTNNHIDINVNKWVGISAGLFLFVSSFLFISGIFSHTIFAVYGFFVVLALVFELFRKKANPLHNWAYFILGQVFIALPFALLNFIIFIDGYQPILLLSVFVTIWVNDTGAYLVGVSFGKHRLFERISPKKSWEGFVGGACFALLSGYVFSLIIPEISLLNWLILSEIVVIFGTLGDLIESLIKRTVHVKDSGNILPGHGGLLDRFDSMLLAAPVVFIFLSIIFNK